MPPLDSLLTRQQLADDLGTPIMRRYIDAWYARDPGPTTSELFRRGLVRSVAMAHNFYVTPEMSVLVSAAADSWEADEPVREDDFPTQQGWLWIPGGIVTIDVRGSAVPTSAILWDVYGGNLHLTFFADRQHPLDALKDASPRELPRLTPWTASQMRLGSPVLRTLSLAKVLPPEVASQVLITRDQGHVKLTFPPDNEEFSAREVPAVVQPDAITVWLISCLRLMQQEITSVSNQGLPANLRRSLRGRVRLKNTPVTVIEYRRKAHVYDDADSGRTFSHRFLRRGHWRQQPFKDEAGEWDRRRIWIAPTIVGDPDLPLLLREHVNVFKR